MLFIHRTVGGDTFDVSMNSGNPTPLELVAGAVAEDSGKTTSGVLFMFTFRYMRSVCVCVREFCGRKNVAARGGSAALHVLSSGNGSFTPKMHSNENGTGWSRWWKGFCERFHERELWKIAIMTEVPGNGSILENYYVQCGVHYVE